jgi:ATP-dependent exoDNAse (exonuclease V) alpha subunit
MAIYFLNLQSLGRSSGSSAVSAAAYRSGERIRDERTGKTYDHSGRQDVMHKEIILPGEFAAHDMGWAHDRGNLWNTAEHAEVRKDARVAREYLVALPAELAHDQRVKLVREFSRELVERYRFALDVAIHAPRDFPGSDSRNFHAHLLATTREVTPKGLGAKTTVEMHDRRRREAGLDSSVRELLDVRKSWANAANGALQAAHIDARIDHRTLAAQGINREPAPHIPRAVFEMERRGHRTVVAERIREEYQARVASRLQRSPQLAAAAAPRSIDEIRKQSQPKYNPEDLAKQSAQNWRRWRDTQPKLNSEDLAKQSAQNWRRWRDTQPKLNSEEVRKQSAENWRRWRDTQPKLNDEELRKQSAENWRRYREAQPKLSAEELQRQSVEKWLRYREERSKSQSPSQSKARTRDHDLSL